MLKLSSDKCCGCTACASICPQNCLKMVDNGEGFLIPKLAEGSSCIDCDLCNMACPVLNYSEEKIKKQQGFIVQNKNEQERI